MESLQTVLEELKKSEERYRTLVENLPDVIYSVSAKNETITSLNKAFEHLTGWPRSDWIGKAFLSLVHPEDLPLAFKTFQQALRGKTPPPYELRIRTKSGGYLVGEFTSSPQIEGGKIVGEFGIVRDITERKKIEQLKEDLIRDVSHELKTPISLAQMAFDMFSRAIKYNDINRIKKAHKMASDNIQRFRKDVENILNLFVLGRKKSIVMKKASLKDIICKVMDDFDPVIKEKKLKVKIALPKNAEKVVADKREITTLFTNIIDNALKFTKRGGITISSNSAGNWIRIKVKDTGTGIAPEAGERIFEKFYKQTTSVPGVGLGLAICKEIVERHNGKIEVASKGVGKGTTVTVSLPNF